MLVLYFKRKQSEKVSEFQVAPSYRAMSTLSKIWAVLVNLLFLIVIIRLKV